MNYSTALNKLIFDFFEVLEETQEKRGKSLSSQEMLELWENGKTDKKSKKKVSEKVSEDKVKTEKKSKKKEEKVNTEDFDILKATVPELKAMCKTKGLKCGGKKAELIERLLKGEQPEEKKTKSSSKSKSEKSEKSEKSPKLHKANPPLSIRRNKFGNYEHVESNFIFDKVNKVVIGKQNDNGNIDPLTAKDINLCETKYNFEYKLPDNLGDGEEEKTKDDKKEEDNEDEVEEVEEEDNENEEDEEEEYEYEYEEEEEEED